MSNPKKFNKTKASMSVMDGIHHRRSVRNYTSQTIEKNVIHTLLDAAVHCRPGWNVCDETNVSTPELKIRAECGNTACSDLCGGPEATPVPTATVVGAESKLQKIADFDLPDAGVGGAGAVFSAARRMARTSGRRCLAAM